MEDAIDALDLMAAGTIRPVIDRTFSLDQVNEAMDYLRGGKARGRVIIKPE